MAIKNRFKIWLLNTPISKRLHFLAGIMSIVLFIIIGIISFSIINLSALRAYVTGEALWSKAQKDAVYYLTTYGNTKNEAYYQKYLEEIKVPIGDRLARVELEKESPNKQIARQGFLDGRNHPSDIDGLIRLFRQFRHLSYMDKAIQIWTDADPYLFELQEIGLKLHQEIKTQEPNEQVIKTLLGRLGPLNEKVTKLEGDFSYTLGEASHWLEGLVLKLLIAVLILADLIGVYMTLSLAGNISKGLNELLRGTQEVAKGNLYARVHIYAHDEIGRLSRHFNLMTKIMHQKLTDLQLAEEQLRREKDRAENSEKVKQIFLTNMSHEIRTPLNGILGFARLLESANLNEEQNEYVSNIVKSGDNLLVILNDILDLSKIEAGKLKLEKTPFSFIEVTKSAIAMIGPTCDQKGLKLLYTADSNLPQRVEGDPVRLSQILSNLLSNAVKFTETGEIECVTKLKESNHSKVSIQVTIRDTGIGIPFRLQAKIFKSFEQATSDTTRKFGGTGLGLSIVKELVELQGGKIWLASQPKKGSEFSFIIPYVLPADANEPVTIQVTPTEETISDISILVVEDNPVNQLLVTRVLQKFGFKVDIAGNGVQALEQLQNNHHYDIIIMDIQMPEMDGYETTRHIRNSQSKYTNIPILAMTAHTIAGEIEKCLNAGMTDFISKPFNPQELREKLINLASNHVS